MADLNIKILSGIWFYGWLFTWGYAGLTGMKIFYSMVGWAYYLGQAMGGIV